jgi:hypothetical protein
VHVKAYGPINKKVRLTCERIRLSFVFLSFSLHFSHVLSFVSCLLFVFFGAFYYKNKMDERRHKILVVLVFTMAIHQVITQVVSLQQVNIRQHWSMMSALLFLKRVCAYVTKSLEDKEV